MWRSWAAPLKMEMRLGVSALKKKKKRLWRPSPSAVQALSLSVYHRNVCGHVILFPCFLLLRVPGVPGRCENISYRSFCSAAVTPFGRQRSGTIGSVISLSGHTGRCMLSAGCHTVLLLQLLINSRCSERRGGCRVGGLHFGDAWLFFCNLYVCGCFGACESG